MTWRVHTASTSGVLDERAGKHPFMANYVADLPNVVDIEAIRSSGLHIGADPMGGASVDYWAPLRRRMGSTLTWSTRMWMPRGGS